MCLFQRMLICFNGIIYDFGKKISVRVVKISGWQSFQTLQNNLTLNAMYPYNLKIFVWPCTWKAEQLGSMHEYHETKTCHKGDLTLEEKIIRLFLCLLIFKHFKSRSCIDILFLKQQRWIKPNAAGHNMAPPHLCKFPKIKKKKKERKGECTLLGASFYAAASEWAWYGHSILL